jgi:hypothetical protein
MHRSMMEPTQTHQIVRLRLAAVRPVDDVMSIQVAAVCASGKSATLVSRFQHPPQRRRDRAGLAPGIQWLALLALDHRNQAGVA